MNKKIIKLFAILFMLTLLVISLCGCMKEYTVTFVSDDETVSTVSVKQNKTVSEYNLTKEGYTLTGWYNGEELYDFNTKVTADLTLNAKWEINQYSVKFVMDDGTVISENTYAYNADVNIPTDVVKEKSESKGYTFVGWDKEVETKATSDMTYTAKFDEYDLYIVTYYDIDNIVLSELYYEKGEEFVNLKYDINDTTDYDYTFTSWVDDKEEKVDESYIVNNNLDVYPTYTKKRLTLEGAKISFVGDSISTFYSSTSEINSYYSGDGTYYYPIYSTSIKTADQTWWVQTLNKCNAVLGINNSWSGTTCYNYGNEENSGAMNYGRLKTLNENGEPDVIIVNIGTNDLGGAKPLDTFKNSYRTMMNRIDELYPNAIKFVCTFEYSILSTYTQENRYAYNEIVRKIAEDSGYYVIEFASVITEQTYVKYLGDRLHPSYDGAVAMADLASQTLKAYFNNTLSYANLNYELDGGSLLDETTVCLSGEVLNSITAPTKEDYDFSGWYSDADFNTEVTFPLTVKEDMTLYAKWVESPKGVTFELNGGMWSSDATSYLTETKSFTLNDYNTSTFWTLYKSNTYCYPKDNAQNPKFSCRIQFNYDSLTGLYKVTQVNKSGDSGVVYEADYVIVISSGYEGYSNLNFEKEIVAGMYLDLGCDLSTKEAGTYNLEAKFYNESELTSSIGRNFDVSQALPTPVKDGYIFDGWYKEADFSGTKVTSAIEGEKVYAKWVQIN